MGLNVDPQRIEQLMEELGKEASSFLAVSTLQAVRALYSLGGVVL